MSPRLEEISAERYADEVLPLTQALWSDGRTLHVYRQQTAEIAAGAYGRTGYRTVALCGDGGEMLASFKRYYRDARLGTERLRAMGIGAVFTPEPLRGRGYASAMLGSALDGARAGGVDFAFLFSDIHPQFYKELGFVELSSRSISFRADALPGARIEAQPIGERDWTQVRTCFEEMEASRTLRFTRPPAVWNWMRLRIAHAAQRPHAQPVNLLVRRGRAVAAYVLGRREPRHDAYVLDELAFCEGAREFISPLLRSAAGDLRRIAGWLPPAPARAVLPRGSVRKRSDALFMAAPLTEAGTRWLEQARTSSPADSVWPLDHV